MKLNQAPNLRVEDFPSEQSWIGSLFSQLNPFITAVNQVFDSNIDFATNIKTVSRDYSITTFQAFSLQWPYKSNPPLEVSIIKATKGAQMTPAILFVAWGYDATNGLIHVTEILEASSSGMAVLNGTYNFTLRATV
jgi:hypothetical protein